MDFTYEMKNVPSPKDASWKNIKNRKKFEEFIRIHLFDAIDRQDSTVMPNEEREKWEDIISALGELAHYYKKNGHNILEH